MTPIVSVIPWTLWGSSVNRNDSKTASGERRGLVGGVDVQREGVVDGAVEFRQLLFVVVHPMRRNASAFATRAWVSAGSSRTRCRRSSAAPLVITGGRNCLCLARTVSRPPINAT